MSSSLGSEILSRWQRFPEGPIDVSGLHSSSRSYSVADLLSRSDRCVAVVCPTSDDATCFHQDLKAFLSLLGREDLIAAVDFFPGWEHSPYQTFNPSIKTRIRRLRALSRIRLGLCRAVVTDAKAFAQRCPSAELIGNRTITLRPADIITRDELIARLESAGYSRNDPVEDPGSYAVRGSLFDIFSPASRRPYRLDFFDDMLESIRTFDPLTQRSDPQPIDAAAILPVSDLSFSQEQTTRARSELKRFCDEFGIPKQSRDDVVEKIDAGVRDPAFDYLLPFFLGDQLSWLPDFLFEAEKPWVLALSDSLGIESAYDKLIADLKKGFIRKCEEGGVAASWDRLYAAPDQFNELLKQRTRLTLNEIELGVPDAVKQAPGMPDTGDIEDAASPEADETEIPKLRPKVLPNTDLRPLEGQKFSLEIINNKAKAWSERGYTRVFVASTASQAERVSFILSQKNIGCRIVQNIDWADTSAIQITEAALSSGFRLPRHKLVIVTDSELFGPKKLRPKTVQKEQPVVSMGSFVSSLEDLSPEDLIVHTTHGIGRYKGLVKLEIDKVPQDFLLIEYAGNDKLYLPVYRLDLVQRYAGATGDAVSLDKLGSSHFEKAKEKVKAALQDLANQLLQLYAKRASRHGFSFSPPDEPFREFEARFPYAETADQMTAIEAVMGDMASSQIMDRLICGDVGYGKTEVAMRAAFRAVADGKQVAVLVPTTVLALQHERSFRDRFAGQPIAIAALSRFKTPKEIKEAVSGLREGKIDLVIGTHRLLSKDVAFKDLGLVIIDEEQRFGVEHKERLKMLRINTDVLTLTATPIPRTLQLSLMGLRDISVINTPPVDRLSVRTYVARFDENIIENAIRQELSRGGQVFFIHNRVQSINAMADRIQRVVPEAKIIVAHGQLEERELEKRMLEFYNKKGNVLICSTIIESGLDIASTNTMIINRADTFGLAQLYQLRGRVGRSQVRAYCYLLLPEEGAVTEDAKKRLEVIQRFVDLGSGFKIASHDLELRGGGDILGKSQSGHIAAVGFELYTDLLDEAIRELRGQPIEDHFDPEMKLPVATLLPESYVPDVHQRLGLYKRLSQAPDGDTLHALELELQDRYGKPPVEVQNLFWLIRLKQVLRHYHIKSVVAGKERTAIDASPAPNAPARIAPTKVLVLVQKEPRTYSVTPDSKIVIKRPFQSAQQLFHDVEKFLAVVAEA